jgi:hypothetical protein
MVVYVLAYKRLTGSVEYLTKGQPRFRRNTASFGMSKGLHNARRFRTAETANSMRETIKDVFYFDFTIEKIEE